MMLHRKKQSKEAVIAQSPVMMLKLCLHRNRLHLLDAAPVFVICVNSGLIMFISLSH